MNTSPAQPARFWRADTVALAALLALVVIVAFSGCSAGRRADPRPPAVTITGPGPDGGSLTQTGDAAAPATADTSTGTSGFTIPAGQPVSIAPDGVVSFTAAVPIQVAAQFSSFRAAGPAAFTPPAPPSPADEARGWGVRAFYLAALGCALVAGLLAWRGYPLAALCTGGAALALPIVGNVVSSAAGIVAGSVLLALAAGLVLAYKLTAKRIWRAHTGAAEAEAV